MAHNWKPGDVAMTVPDGMRAVRDGRGQWFVPEVEQRFYMADSEVRPLVVIDPEDRGDVDRLLAALDARAHAGCESGTCRLNQAQAALRDHVDWSPPHPREPSGLGAVIEDNEGDRWIFTGLRDIDEARWWCHGFARRKFRHINAVRVLSEGLS